MSYVQAGRIIPAAHHSHLLQDEHTHFLDPPPQLHCGNIVPVTVENGAAVTTQSHIHAPGLHTLSLHAALPQGELFPSAGGSMSARTRIANAHDISLQDDLLHTDLLALSQEAGPRVRTAPLIHVAQPQPKPAYTGDVDGKRFFQSAAASAPLPMPELKFRCKVGNVTVGTTARKRQMMKKRSESQTFRASQAAMNGHIHLDHSSGVIAPLADKGIVMQPLVFTKPALEINMEKYMPRHPAHNQGGMRIGTDMVGLSYISLSLESRRQFQPMEALTLSHVPEHILYHYGQ
mmetsp:Transcript_21534/g.54271  ORF Transcript_21534/g.54271 Transcript_21534/m.54271 type:complete len:290 (-) Transcript_21534:468-1337(-)|eukprot:CAMPEP_0178989774 /NCGR_PEP_ID=MMETSP0795-20121207/4564_1 /TAXON_ID=88552 /ORGANISM="Amoebophrya sp., Strain Ameob2" /LENGTH=289 /DNA_ID=CAMNT_0020681219 /DNA_START=206 /DNA_END=1075 /DNA_ORIENTATION=-